MILIRNIYYKSIFYIVKKGELHDAAPGGCCSTLSGVSKQGSHRYWKTWKMKVVMEKSWNMNNWPKVMGFWDFNNFSP